MDRPIQVDPNVYFWGAVALLVFPVSWGFAAIMAAVFHELCHYAAIRLFGARILSMKIGPGGAVMETSPMGRGAEAFCAGAGPMGSLILLLIAQWMPRVALCAAVQGLFNLLPIFPLDGGRVLRCLVPKKICRWVQNGTAMFLLFAGWAVSFFLDVGMMPVLFAITVCVKALARKIPCKQSR